MANAIARKDDSVMSKYGSGNKCGNPFETKVGEVNDREVYANGKLVVCLGNTIFPHSEPDCTPIDTSVLTKASTKVYINGKGVGRIGDEYTVNNVITQGSSNVFAG